MRGTLEPTLLALLLISLTADAQIFRPATDHALPADPHALAVADLDGDDAVDVAVADSHGLLVGVPETVSVFLNAGDGTFPARTDYMTGKSPNGIVAADLDLDGDVDLATANQGGDLRALRNDGSGAFEEILFGVGFVPARAPWALVAADLDRDKAGAPDLAIVNAPTHDLFVFLNDGSGFFSRTDIESTCDGPAALVAADLDGRDGPDLVVGCFTDEVQTFLNDGAGGFVFGRSIAVDVSAEGGAVAAADLDRDGDMDLAVAGGGVDAGFSVLLNDGTGAFPSETGYGADVVAANALTVGDLNCDGRLDLAVANDVAESVSVFLGNAKARGTFHFDRDYPVGAYPTAIAAADLNADGALDLAVSNHDDKSLSILLNFGCRRRVCRAAKLKAASRLAGDLLDCHARAKGRDLPVDAGCLSRAQAAVAQTFAGAEAKGECNTTGNASGVGAALEGLAAAVSQELPGSPGDANANRCAAAKLKAAGKRAKGALGCAARAAKGDDPVDRRLCRQGGGHVHAGVRERRGERRVRHDGRRGVGRGRHRCSSPVRRSAAVTFAIVFCVDRGGPPGGVS